MKMVGMAWIVAVWLIAALSAEAQRWDVDGASTAAEEELRWLVNRARFNPAAENARLGTSFVVPEGPLPPLASQYQLISAARKHADDMARTGTFSHQSPTGSRYYAAGSQPWERAAAEGYDWGVYGENIAAGYLNAAAAHAAWFLSDVHRANMLRSDFMDVGHGVLTVPGSQYETYFSQEFATWWMTTNTFFTDTVFSDRDGDNAYDAGEGVECIQVQLSTATAMLGDYDCSGATGGFAVPMHSIPSGTWMQVWLRNATGVDKVLTIPRASGLPLTLRMIKDQLVYYGGFVHVQGRNVGFRNLNVFAKTPAVRFPVSYPGWIAVMVYDQQAGQWVAYDNRYQPTEVRIDNLITGHWYFIAIWDYTISDWSYLDWFARI